MFEIKNRIGMFDFFKGLGMIFIIFAHCIYTQNNNSVLLFWVYPIFAIIGLGLMPAFLMISGYGFRKKPLKKCIRQQASLMLKPYLWVMIGCSCLHLLTRYIMSKSIKIAIKQTWSVAGGFLLALPSPIEYNGIVFYNCGPMWYIIALFIGWIVLDYILLVFNERNLPFVVFVVVNIGWWIGRNRVSLFCVSQGLIAVGFLYFGYLLKKKKVLQQIQNKKYWILFGVSVIFSIIILIKFGQIDNMAEGIWNVGIISILADSVIGCAIIYFFIVLGNFKFVGKNIIDYIGRNSLYFFCAHTVEYHGIPWYLLVEKLSYNKYLQSIVVFVLRMVVILLIIFGINVINSIGLKRKTLKTQ